MFEELSCENLSSSLHFANGVTYLCLCTGGKRLRRDRFRFWKRPDGAVTQLSDWRNIRRQSRTPQIRKRTGLRELSPL